ncbi:MAG: hypothetical protein U0Y68_13380 [Blastocatellia bacterium]
MNNSKRIFKTTITLFALSAALFSLALWPSTQGTASVRSITNEAALQKFKFPKISISINVGRKKKGVCNSGFGICSITLGHISSAPRSVKGELIRTEDGRLELTLLKKASEEGRTLFVDEDIQLSAEIAQKLGVKNATI